MTKTLLNKIMIGSGIALIAGALAFGPKSGYPYFDKVGFDKYEFAHKVKDAIYIAGFLTSFAGAVRGRYVSLAPTQDVQR